MLAKKLGFIMLCLDEFMKLMIVLVEVNRGFCVGLMAAFVPFLVGCALLILVWFWKGSCC